MSERVVVTGVGAVTPLGLDFPSTWRQLVAGKTAAAPVTLFDVAGCRCKQAATCALPDLAGHSREETGAVVPCQPTRAARRPRSIGGSAVAGWSRKLAPRSIAAFRQHHGGRHGVGGTVPEGHARPTSRCADSFTALPDTRHNIKSHDLQQHLGFRGPVTIIANACASGANAIGHGADLIRSGACATACWPAATRR